MGGGGGEGDIQYARKSNLGLFLNNKQRPLTQTISCSLVAFRLKVAVLFKGVTYQ